VDGRRVLVAKLSEFADSQTNAKHSNTVKGQLCEVCVNWRCYVSPI